MRPPRRACVARVAFAAAILLAGCAPKPDPTRLLIDEVLETHAAHELDEPARHLVAEALLAAEAEFGVPALLLLALIERESRFDPRARGALNARGLMQVRPATARAMAVQLEIVLEDSEDLFDARTNIRLGTAYLARMHERFDDWNLALTAFNVGPTRLRQLQAQRPMASSRYSRHILARYEAWQASLAE